MSEQPHPTNQVEEPDSPEILDEAASAVYERSDKYGEPEDSFDTIAELWNGFLRGGGVADPNLDGADVANMMVLLKVARNSQGHYHEDNWVDIAGYAESGARVEK